MHRYLSAVFLVSFSLSCSDCQSADPQPDAAVNGDASDLGSMLDSSIAADGSVDPDLPARDMPAQPDSANDADEMRSSDMAGIDAATCEQADVEAALVLAADGDVVNVPAGDCAWSGLILDRPIHLRGAGVDATNITVDDVDVRKQVSGLLRVSGFHFQRDGGGTSAKGFVVSGAWQGTQPVVFQDNRFTISNSGLFLLNCVGGVIIARNAFTGGWDDSFIQPKHSGDPDGSWAAADTLGANDADGLLNHYIEDNTFEGGTNQGIDADDATRVVYRHNTLTYSSFNTHGYATSSDGVRHFEVYGNTFVHNGGETMLANQNWLIWLRGGTGVIFDNQFTDIAGGFWGDKSELKLTIRGAEDARPQGDCADVAYPVPRQLGQGHDGQSPIDDPIYIWDNLGAQEVAADWNWGNPCGLNFGDFLQFGRDIINGTPRPGYTAFAHPHLAVVDNP